MIISIINEDTPTHSCRMQGAGSLKGKDNGKTKESSY